MKILHIIESLRSGGKERQLVETLKFLSKHNGITCDVVIMSDDIHYSYIEELNIKIHKITRKSKKDPIVFLKFYQLFSEIKPNVVHSWGSMCSVYAVPAVKLLRIKFVNNFLRDAPAKFSVQDTEWWRAKLTFPFSNVIAANSHAGLESYNVPYNKRACLHNGFDFSRIKGLDSDKSIRKKLNIMTENIVGMVATFSDKKDYKTFFDAAQIILKQRQDVTFIAIGDGENFDKIQKQIRPEFNKYFRMPGRQQRVLNIVQIFNIGILSTNISTHGEGIPNAVMEYMSLKKPVIVTDCGGNRELVDDNYTGFLVKAQDSKQMANKILLLLDNKTLATSFGNNGRNKLIKEFNLNVMGEAFLNLYRVLK